MKDNIQSEIEEIAPLLASMDKKNPFMVPKGYFNFLENRTLVTLGKNPISAKKPPTGYFDNLSDQILERVSKEEQTKIIPIYRRTWLTIAASFLIVAGAIFVMNTQGNSIDNNPEYVLEVEADEALDYLVANGDLYLSDLISLDIYEYDLNGETSNFEILEETDLDEFLNNLDQEDLEDLL